MATVRVALSSVADGSMLNRHDELDSAVIQNRHTFLSAHDFDLIKTVRVDPDLLRRIAADEHDFCRYLEVSQHDYKNGIDDASTLHADALITTEHGVSLALPLADCIGAVLFDPAHGVLMVSHLGRHSLEQQGGAGSVTHLVNAYGARPEEIKVWLTPAAGKAEYTIWALNNQSMKEAVHEQLLGAGIQPENIHDDTRETTSDYSLYSYSEFLKGHRTEDGDHMIVAVIE